MAKRARRLGNRERRPGGAGVGPRLATWQVGEHGVDVSLTLETFGGPEGQNSFSGAGA